MTLVSRISIRGGSLPKQEPGRGKPPAAKMASMDERDRKNWRRVFIFTNS